MASTEDFAGRVGPASTSVTASSAPSPAPPGEPGAGNSAGRSNGRSVLVGLILALLIGSTLLMMAFIWYRWVGVSEPTTAVIVEGDASLDGTEITVRGPSRRVTAKLTPENNFIAPILLEPGLYWVVAQRDGQVLIRKQVEVKRFLGVRFELAEYVEQAVAQGLLPPLPATRPTPSDADPSKR